MTRICIYGCGAIGGLLAARLAHVADVSVIARGEQLTALQTQGLTLLNQAGEAEPGLRGVRLNAVAAPDQLPAQDLVFLTTKSHALPGIARSIAPLLHADTVVVTATNGVPWWYFHGLESPIRTPELVNVDPGHALWQTIDPERALGCVVYPAAELVELGSVRHVYGNRFALGEPGGAISERLRVVTDLLRSAGYEAAAVDDIRAELWAKLAANAALNPVSVITGKLINEMLAAPATRQLLENVMTEVTAVAVGLGTQPAMTPAELLAAMQDLGPHRTSMQQDLLAGRPLELGPVVAAILELAALRGISTPNLSMVYQLARSREAAENPC
jgi:2-dehydropantoate 2-reductase